MSNAAAHLVVDTSFAFLGGYVSRGIAGAFADPIEDRRLENLHVATASEGVGLPLVYGRARLAGAVIWAARFTETRRTTSAGKGGPRQTSYGYTASFAVAVGEGPVDGIGRIWADGRPLALDSVVWRFHRGDEAQVPDPLILAVEGPDAPAFRGTAYVVFEDLDIGPFGDRTPQMSFEVYRRPASAGGAPALEDLARAVTLIPGSGEFAYAPIPVMREIRPGEEKAENVNSARGVPDLIAALDDLEAQLPNVDFVTLVVSWFGTDLRCGACRLRPGVERTDKVTRPSAWRVGGVGRSGAYLISQTDGAPSYGGTPDDASVRDAIHELKARGYRVGLYPFILMDIPSGGALPDPYGGASQGAFPWRGRITCHPAPGRPASPDGTASAEAQVEAFFGHCGPGDFAVSEGEVAYAGADEHGLRRMVLHYAHLAQAAGGVDAFVMASELRGLTTVRGAGASYPAVERLVTLAGDVRGVIGPNTILTYAADWSEYFGHHPADGSGDVRFHLDPLWAHDAIDVVGIDWYPPMADWRDGDAHRDALAWPAVEDRGYLQANIEGGEGFDWWYPDAAARDAQIRSPIADGAYGKPWVYRVKDLRAWWGTPHYERTAGVEAPHPTAWIPESKPIWLVEAGCPAVDKGPNQPNVFFDPGSSESALPHYSTGARDDLVQRRALEALLDYWNPSAGRNPISGVYGGAMIAWDRIGLWTWDARPFPDFPARGDVWADGDSWTRGHWLTGRAGAARLRDIIYDVAGAAGVTHLDADGIDAAVAGVLWNPPLTARSALEELASVFGFDMADQADALVIRAKHAAAPSVLALADLGLDGERAGVTRNRADPGETPNAARLRFINVAGDFETGSVQVYGLNATGEQIIDLAASTVLDHGQAAVLARARLVEAQRAVETVRFAAPPTRLDLEIGDDVRFEGQASAYRVVSAAEDGARRFEAVRLVESSSGGLRAGPAAATATPATLLPSRPIAWVVDAPVPPVGGLRGGPIVAAAAAPWPGRVEVSAGPSAAEATTRTSLADPVAIGALEAATPPGPIGRWDDGAVVIVRMTGPGPVSANAAAVLGGANLAYVRRDDGAWEPFGFREAAPLGAGRYALSGLIRGGAGGRPSPGASSGAPIVLYDHADQAVAPVLPDHERGVALTWRFAPTAGTADPGAARIIEAAYASADGRPAAPVHLAARRTAGDIALTWIRAAQVGGDDWAVADPPWGDDLDRYRVEVLSEGAVVWSAEVDGAAAVLTAADEAASFENAPLATIKVRVRQYSSRLGWGWAGESLLVIASL